MLVRSPLKLEQGSPRRWSLLSAGVMLSLAVLLAGVRLSHASPFDATKDEPKKDKDAKKEEPKKEQPKKEQDDPLPGFPDLDELLKRLPGGLDDETAKLLRQQMDMTRKMLEQMRKQRGGALQQLPGIGGLLPIPQLRVPRMGRIPAGGQGMTEPRLGVRLDKPSATIVDQLDLPRDQGMIVEEMREDSAAAKAGLKRHDILLELGGKPVPSNPQQLNKLLQGIKADEAVEAVVMRKSKKETIKNLKLPKGTPEQPGNRNPFRLQFEQPFGILNNALGGSTSVTRTNDNFTLRHQDNGVTISIKGKVEAGKSEPTEIVIQEGETSEKYESVDKVPEAHREKVRELLQRGGADKVRRFNLGQ